MYWQLIHETIRRPRTRRRALWSVLAISLGTAVAAAMLNVSIDIGDKMGEEVRALGPNVTITPAAHSIAAGADGALRPVAETAAIRDSELSKLKSIFWRNNIKSFSPFLSASSALSLPSEVSEASADSARSTSKGSSEPSANAESSELPVDSVDATLTGVWFDHLLIDKADEKFRTGIRTLNPSWKVTGNWVADHISLPDNEFITPAMIGDRLARRLRVAPGAIINSSLTDNPRALVPRAQFRIDGILSTGTEFDDQVIVPIRALQAMTGRIGEVDSVQVSALIKPEDELSRRDPKTMSAADYDRWFCAPYLSSIMFQIGGALPGTVVRPIREVAETQGNILDKLTFLMALLAALALIAAAMGISSLASLTVIERRQEIAVMKAIGARDGAVSTLLMTEMALQGLAGGVVGFFGGQLLAALVARTVFDTSVATHWILLPAMLVIALAVSLAGTWLPVHRAVRQEPAPVLRGE